jgi:hypothetical protein
MTAKYTPSLRRPAYFSSGDYLCKQIEMPVPQAEDGQLASGTIRLVVAVETPRMLAR